MKLSRQTWLGILITALVAAALLAPTLQWGLWHIYFRIRERASRVPFEADAWQQFRRQYAVGRTNYWAFKLPIRLRMIDDLLGRYDLQGRTRAEVVALLGEKDQTEHFRDWDLIYWLGPGRFGDAIGDSEWLVIRFDPGVKVCDYRVVHD